MTTETADTLAGGRTSIRQSERNEAAKREAFQHKPAPVTAGEHLGADHYLRPDWAARMEAGDGVMQSLAAAHRNYREGHQNLRQAYESRDPTVTPEAHFLQTRQLGERWLSDAAKASDRSRERAEMEIKAERAQIESDLGLVENHRAAEIRQLLRGMNPDERGKLLQEAVAARDPETIAAVTSGPAFLSGLTSEQVKALRRQYEATYAGERLARIDALTKAVEINRATALEALRFYAALLPDHKAQEITGRQKAAQELRSRMSSD